MEKNNNMQQNMVSDDELEQVGGGKFLNVFTTEFRKFIGRLDDQGNPVEEDDDQFGIRTLEMRIDPKKKDERNGSGIVKL